MEESLKAWIELACRDILGVQDADCNLFEDNLYTVSKHVFQSPHSSFEELHQTGARALNLREDDTSLLATSIIVLKFAVSSECEHKSTYVSHIISMDSDLQEQLMLAIQNQSLVINDDDDVDNSESDVSFENDVSEIMDDNSITGDTSESFEKQRNDGESSKANDLCENCHKIEKELENHAKQISDLLKREKDLEEKLKEENTTFLTKNMDIEDTLREKEALLADKEAHILACEKNESDMMAKVQNFEILTETVSNLQDEVDVLRPLVKRAESAESQLSRMHEKLDKLDGIKDQLKAEVDSHNETQAELLKLQVEVDTLRKAKVQVVEYRDRCAENSITIGDLTSQLVNSKEEVEQLTLKLNQLSEGHQVTESYSKSLVDELKVASEALRNSERDCGIGGGISELNPEISKELNKLRVENAELLSKLDLTSVESLDKLQQDLSDQACINTSLQQKWTKSKDAIETLTRTILELEAEVANWKESHKSLVMIYQETSAMAEQDRLASALKYTSKLTCAEKMMDDSHFLLARGQQAVVNELQQEYNATFTTLSKTESDLNRMTQFKNRLEIDVVEKNELVEMESKKRKRAEEDFCLEKNKMLSEFDAEKSAISIAQENSEQELKQKFKFKLDTERAKNLNLAADMEEEKLKRRKLDREKRFHESECHRYKSQLHMQSQNTDNNVEIESALKEMKSMQEQLDAAKSQIAMLQSRAGSADSNELSGAALVESKKPATTARRMVGGSNAQRVNPRGDNLSTYVEQSDMYERKIEMMTRERREMIAKNLEENKERMELNQKLLQCEKETASYKSKVTKLTLEKERLARRLAKQEDQENIPRAVPLL